MNFSRRGLSVVVGYVLLIVITISLSVLIYSWLRFYVQPDNIKECSDKINIVIKNYECVSGAGGNITVTLQNKGLLKVDGYVLRANNRTDAEFGIYDLNMTGAPILPGGEQTNSYSFSDVNLTSITLVEVQPFIRDGGKISCMSSTAQNVVCS